MRFIPRSWLLLGAGMLIAAVGVPTIAQHGHRLGHGAQHSVHGQAERHGGGLDLHELMSMALHHLDVSDAQRDELMALHEQHGDEVRQLESDLDSAHHELAKAIHGDVFDEGAIRQAAADLADLQADQFVMIASHLQELRQVLSDEQLEKLHEVHEKVAKAHGGRLRLHP